MENETILRGLLKNAHTLRLTSEPEKLFHVSGDTIMMMYDHREHILYCRFEGFWENLKMDETLRDMISTIYKDFTAIDHPFIVRPGIYQGDYLKRSRTDVMWEWEQFKEELLDYSSESSAPPDIGPFLP